MIFRGTLQDIRLFVAAYEEGSFTAAGLRENTAQSGVSQHIRNLEDAYCVRLFLRERTRVLPTPAADAFYKRCSSIMQELAEAAEELRDYSGSYVEKITIGMMPALNRRIIASTLLRYEEQHPNVKILVIEAMSPQFRSMIKAGDVDFALCVPVEEDRAIRVTPIVSIPDCMIMRSRPDDRDAIAHHLPVLPIKICWASGGYGRRDALINCISSAGMIIGQDRELDSAFAALDLVGRSDWVTIGPSILLDPKLDAGQYALRPLCPRMFFEVALLEDKATSLNPAARAFLDILIEEILNAVADWERRFREAGV
jgi:LysR family nitrogen assimilation transcriptional regulator